MENSRCEKAVEKKHNGYNCAQAVACSFCKEASMDEDTLKKITQGFGAGLGTMAGTCGAISGPATPFPGISNRIIICAFSARKNEEWSRTIPHLLQDFSCNINKKI